MLLMAIAFFLNVITGILFGSAIHEYLFETGWSSYDYGLFNLIGFGLQIVFTILMVVGLYLLHKEMKQQLQNITTQS